MMADNIEHVISYWVIFQKFQSPALGGFAVVSHWVPYLFFAGFSGGLADRFDTRRLIQIGMLLLLGVSVCWGILFLTDSVALWKAMLLLVVHGFAGVIWIPASQVLIHQIVRADQLPSAVRLSATGRYLGFLVGPAVGAGLLLILGPAYGILANAAIYAPMVVWLIKAPYGRADANWRPASPALNGVTDIWSTMKIVAQNRVLLAMTVLVGASSFFVGNAYQAQMPGFARDLGHGRADFSYSALLAADAGGGLVGGLLLESRAMLLPRPAHGVCPRNDLVRRARRLRPCEYLCVGHQLIVRCGLRGTCVQLDGPSAGADARARRHARTSHRRVFDVGNGYAHVQWSLRRAARRQRGHS